MIKRIRIVYDKSFPTYLKTEVAKVSILGETNSGETVNLTSDPSCKIYSLDEDHVYIDPNQTPTNTIDVTFRKEGSGVVKATYIDGFRTLNTSKQFLCHDSFFKDSYLNHLVSSFDKTKIESSPYVKSIFDTLMEMIDILYAYNEDLRVIPSFKNGKSSFLSLLGQNIGFERIDFTSLNTSYEKQSNSVFKELISNMLSLLSIRGTKLAYELFFGALGYNISIQEFWYDGDGNLIEINSDDESTSTYYAYRTDGTNIDDPLTARPDPRKNQKDSTSVFRNNKTNYVRVTIDSSKNIEFAENPSSFSDEKRLMIRKYLEFLRPSHIQYITEAFGGLVNMDELFSFDEEFIQGRILNWPEIIEAPPYEPGLQNPVSEEIFNAIFGNVSELYEQFIIGVIKNISSEFASKIRWDSGLRFDRGERWDGRRFLDDTFNAVRI